MNSTISTQARNVNWLLSSFVENTSGVEQAIAVSSDGLLIALEAPVNLHRRRNGWIVGAIRRARRCNEQCVHADRVERIEHELVERAIGASIRRLVHRLGPVLGQEGEVEEDGWRGLKSGEVGQRLLVDRCAVDQGQGAVRGAEAYYPPSDALSQRSMEQLERRHPKPTARAGDHDPGVAGL